MCKSWYKIPPTKLDFSKSYKTKKKLKSLDEN